jgi:hypothetical protein
MNNKLKELEKRVKTMYLAERNNTDDFAMIWCMALEWVLEDIKELKSK